MKDNGRPDRRKDRTRQLLRDALFELIAEKGYEAVNIQEIAERANVARPTFYLHFDDKFDLLITSLIEFYEELVTRTPRFCRDGMEGQVFDPTQIAADDFTHVRQHEQLYRILLSEKGSIGVLMMIMAYLRNITESEILKDMSGAGDASILPTDFVASYLAGAQIGVTDWWLKQGQQYSPEQVAAMMQYMCLFGLNWVHSLNLPRPTAEALAFTQPGQGST
jgi:AcrR family transcriptional regulator